MTLTTWVQAGNEELTYDLVVPLYRYAQIVNVDECAFWGVMGEWQAETACGVIWTKHMRDSVARYLRQAQEMIEEQLNYPMLPRWVVDEQMYKPRVLAEYGYITEIGGAVETVIASGVALDHADDPATLIVLAPDLTNLERLEDIRIYYPGTDYRIFPQSITVIGDDLVIRIPRCRTVALDKLDNPPTGLAYTDLTNFITAVDVAYVYNDPLTQATLITPHRCTAFCAANGCSEDSYDACLRIIRGKIGALEVRPTATTVCGPGGFERVRMYYRAGRWNSATSLIESAIIRLAHSLMPIQPCDCEIVRQMWTRDHEKPQWTTIERHNSPFGLSGGAWVAWQFVNTPDMRLHRMRII